MPEFKYSNAEKEVEMYGYDEVIKSHCRMCHGGCGVHIYKKEGKIEKIGGDPDCPIAHGTLCPKGIASTQIAYHPDRLTHPLKRVGPKGSGQWEKISWDEALDTIAEKMNGYKKEYGAESILMGYGTGRDNESVIYRFANLLGTPNVLTAGHLCYGPRISTSVITCGSIPVVDYESQPDCVMVWGNNLVIANSDEYKGEALAVSVDKGSKLIVVDPRMTRLAARADIWLQLRPGTDTALALGMANYIIAEELYDKEFVANHVHGWDEFVERVQDYPIDKVSDITWLPEEQIKEAARMFAEADTAGIQWGVAIEQQINCADNNRTLIALMGMTGNLDKKGGQVLFENAKNRNASEFGAHKLLSKEQRAKRLGGDRFRLAGHFAIINPKCAWDAILTEEPYPVKMAMFISSNPVLTRANASEVYKALEKLEFMAVADFFMTPTAELADIVLPASTWLEMDYIGDFWKRHGYILARRKAIQVGECRSDHEMLNELGKRVGQEEYWWDDFEGGLDYILEPLGINFQEFKKMDYIRGEVNYEKYKTKGFSTPTGKLEIYSTMLEKWGYDPLPKYVEPHESPISKPEMTDKYPFILVTGARSPGFFHTENRQLPWLREQHPDPFVEIHPDTARRLGISNGQWVSIESPRGKVRQKAKIFEGIHPQVIGAQHAWWYPEKKEGNYGWKESNINMLTDNSYESCDPAMGSTSVRTLLCNIYPEKQGAK